MLISVMPNARAHTLIAHRAKAPRTFSSPIGAWIPSDMRVNINPIIIQKAVRKPWWAGGDIIPGATVSSAIATLVSAIATALLVAVGIWGVSETKKTLELSERAWVSFTSAQLTQPLQKDDAVHFSVNMTNSGREPASGLVFMI